MEPRSAARARSWILVFPLDPEPVAATTDRIRARGWVVETSQGTEQTVGVVHGPETRAELAAALPPGALIEILPLRSGRDYRWQRARQRFFSAMSLGLALLGLVVVVVPLMGFLRPPPEPLMEPDEILVATAEQVPANHARRTRIKDQPLLVIHTGNERYYALDARCTHMEDCLLEWSPERHQIVCPCHGCVYDVYGNVVQGPPSIPLRSYAVERRGDSIYVHRGARP